MVAAISLLLLSHSFAPAAIGPVSPPPLGRMINVDGYQVHLYCTGTGSPTVVVVGGAFSFDWGLIQPEVAKRTQICTYDPSGTAWSDPYRSTDQSKGNFAPYCEERITELHQVLQNAGISGSFVLVGFSIGGLIERLYAQSYPEQVAGMVIVDHAFLNVGSDAPVSPPVATSSSVLKNLDSPPVLISSSPITLGLEDDQNFRKLPQRNQDLHVWAMSIQPLRPTSEMAAQCSAAVDSATKGLTYPLGSRPLIVISTSNDLPAYRQLQANLLMLSRSSKQLVAVKSSHMIIIDEPELVSTGILEVVNAIRNGVTR